MVMLTADSIDKRVREVYNYNIDAMNGSEMMIWYICLALVIALSAFILKIAFDKKFARMRMFYILVGSILAALTIYLPPYIEKYELITALWGCLINVMQIISLDADYLFFYDTINSAISVTWISGVYVFMLGVIHVAVPAISALTAVTLFVKYLTRIRINLIKKSSKTLHIFSEIREESIVLAKDIRKHDKKCEILFLDSKDKSDYSELRYELRCKVLDEKIENVHPKAKNRKVYFYCISYSEEENLNSALMIMNHLEKHDRNVQSNHFVYLFTADPSAEMIIDSINKGFVNIDLIDEHKTAAYNLLQRYPLLDYARDGNISILVSGFSDVSRQVIRAASWIGQLAGYKLSVSVLGKNIQDQAADFMAAYPGLDNDRYAITFYSYKNDLDMEALLSESLTDCNYIVVAESDDDSQKTVERAIALRRFFYKIGDDYTNEPPIFAYIEKDEKASAVSSLRTAEAKAERRMPYNIIPFGMAHEIYTFKNITESDLDILSRNVHLVYEDIFSDGPIDIVGALERYNLFEVNKNANRANALHIRYKLLMLGLDFTLDENATEVEFKEYLTQEALDRLTLAEHDRWMAFLESEGWVESTIEQANAYKASGISKGRHNCPLLKLHPYICDFDDLKQRSDDLGLPDSTIYDIELIARIPDILHDKWNVSGKYFKIVKH